MWFEDLGRHLAVASFKETLLLLKNDPGFWNIISIRAPHTPAPNLPRAKRVHSVLFDDAENLTEDQAWRCATEKDVRGMLHFADECASEPLLVHCQAGLSRSSAVALVLILQRLCGNCREGVPTAVTLQRAVEILLMIRAAARPNALVLRLGLDQFLPPEVAADSVRDLLNHPDLLFNRFNRGTTHR